MVPPSGWIAKIRGALTGRRESAPSPDTRTVCLFGQSHVACLRRAYNYSRYVPSKGFNVKFILTDKKRFPNNELVVFGGPDGQMIHPSLTEAFQQHDVHSGATETWLVSVVRGNDYNFFGLLEPDPVFDFIHPDLPDLPLRTDAQLVPYAVIKDKFVEKAEIARRFYRLLPRQGIAGVLHIESPPPIPNERQIRRAVDTKFLIKMHGRSKSVGISSPEFRMKLFRCQSDVMREVCADTHVVYVTAPAETLDEHGYLKKRAWQGATHGSSWYGRYMMQKIEAVIAGTREPGT
jgi:hypothetical protein